MTTNLNDSSDVDPDRKLFGTFGGVFTPTLLTILGVIMYLREGWVIGNAGILGGLLIILLAFTITICTGLSMSSITTNIRIGSGGAYAIVSQSLGLEVGGSLGIPRYVSQALAITLYIFGFREGWIWVFPDHDPFLVDMLVFVALWAIAYKSADFAIKTQYIIMVVIAGSLISIVLAAFNGSMQYDIEQVGFWGSFPGSIENGFSGTNFWIVFAVFFPAATGIMAGANMSGDLKDPRRSIPIGTMAAIAVSLVIYVLLAYWLARSATPEELVNNYYVVVDKAYWAPAVVAGIFGATFSSALASMVGAARILQAMGSHKVLPFGDWLGARTRAGEPRNSMIVTGAIVFLTLLVRDLNAVAPLITLFFLITYAMLNVVVLVEQGLGLVSFRPLLRIHPLIPWTGLLGSVMVMFIINPVLSLASIALVLFFYGMLTRRRLDAPFEDVRSGLFVSFAEWAAKRVASMPTTQLRAWKPNLLVPVDDVAEIQGSFSLLQNITYPQGSVRILGITDDEGSEQFGDRLSNLSRAFREKGVFSSATVVRERNYAQSLLNAVQVLKGAFFQPNNLLLPFPDTPERQEEFGRIIPRVHDLSLGVLMYVIHKKARLGQRQWINVWVRDRSPDWEVQWELGNLNLSLLIAYKLKRNWQANIRLITVVDSELEAQKADRFMTTLKDLARLPKTEVIVGQGSFSDYVGHAPQADLNIFGLTQNPNFDFMGKMVETTSSSCIFVLDSGQESVLA